jgi:hypothetical protein
MSTLIVQGVANLNKIILITFTLTLICLAASCAPDPRKDAAAYATRSQADQEAADAEQARLIQQQLHDQQMQQLELQQEIRVKNKQNSIFARAMFIWTVAIFGCLALATVLIYSARSYAIASVGVAKATAQAAMVRANCIQLDPVTRQYPLFLQHVHGSKYVLINANVNSVLMLDLAHEPDRQMISTAGLTQVAGVLAAEAAKSQDPAGMAMINPPIVHSQSADLTLGSGYLTAGKE